MCRSSFDAFLRKKERTHKHLKEYRERRAHIDPHYVYIYIYVHMLIMGNTWDAENNLHIWSSRKTLNIRNIRHAGDIGDIGNLRNIANTGNVRNEGNVIRGAAL